MNPPISRSLMFVCLFLVTETVSGQMPVAPPPRPAILFVQYWGKVTDVGRDFIEVQGLYIEITGQKGYEHRRKAEGGKNVSRQVFTGDAMTVKGPGRLLTATRVEIEADLNTITVTATDGTVSVLRRSKEPPRRFEVSDWLRGGGFGPGVSASYSYRLADIRVGDEVDLHVGQYLPDANPPAQICTGICIQKRPGGRVPPAPGEDPMSGFKHHECMNAMQDWEEFGTPIPDKYHPRGPQAGIAPPPKPITLRIPPSAP
ncbi:MAG: hypothetical protein JWO38_3923 [Gemmataceae bacterium]|nr:hypothetical protein [Gemmataceae bacterium]